MKGEITIQYENSRLKITIQLPVAEDCKNKIFDDITD